jgi:hypothetical protein
MFQDKFGRVDFMGGGVLLKGIAVLMLCYLTFIRKVNVPALFFLFYGIGSLLFLVRIKNLLKAEAALYNGPSSFAPGAAEYEHIIVGTICLFMFLYLSCI